MSESAVEGFGTEREAPTSPVEKKARQYVAERMGVDLIDPDFVELQKDIHAAAERIPERVKGWEDRLMNSGHRNFLNSIRHTSNFQAAVEVLWTASEYTEMHALAERVESYRTPHAA